jgi:hypothetical protein
MFWQPEVSLYEDAWRTDDKAGTYVMSLLTDMRIVGSKANVSNDNVRKPALTAGFTIQPPI